MRETTIDRVRSTKIITIVRGLYGEAIVQLAEALYAGGIEMIEVTFDQQHPEKHADTVQAIRAIDGRMAGRMVVGAGTVTSEALVDTAAGAGARYIVSPDMDPAVIRRTVAAGLVSMPGALTPTEIKQAHDSGADFVKVFPASVMGPAYIRAVRAPLNHIALLAVGGVTEQNAEAFMQAGCAGLGVGGDLVNREWIAQGAFEKITALARRYTQLLAPF